MKDYEKTEKFLNAHATSLSKILNLGADHGHEGRVRETVVVLNSHPPNLYGLRKDHKENKIAERVENSEVREMIGDTINPANYLTENEIEVGGRVGLANNQNNKLRLIKEWQIGGKSNLVNSKNKNEKKAGGTDDLANNLSKSKNVVENEENNDAEKMNNKKKGPKLRPVVGANKSSSRPTSHILSRVIYKVTEIIGRYITTSCESTEEMIDEIEKVNMNMKENESKWS